MARTSFWNAEVYISQEMYDNSWAAIYVLRLLGLFPLGVTKNQSGLVLKYRPLYAFYSCVLATLTLSAIYYRLYEEIAVEKKGVHIRRNTDIFVRYTAVNAFCFLVFHQVFIVPSKLLKFFSYIKCIKHVDSIINTTFLKSDRYKSLLLLTMPLMYNVTTDILDVCFYSQVYDVALLGTLRRNISYYTTYLMGFAVICINRYIAHCLEIRIIEINKILEAEYLTHKMERVSTNSSSISGASHYSEEDDIFVISQSTTVPLFSSVKTSITVTKITQAYLKLMDAAHMINNIFGTIIVVAVTAILCNLVLVKYFIILTLEGKGRTLIELLDWIAVFSVQIIRLLLVIEPWHACAVQLENIKRQICNLLSLNVDTYYKQKVDSFAMIVCLRQFKFSACGLFTIDRLLYTTLIDITVFFLVISLQAEEQDTA